MNIKLYIWKALYISIVSLCSISAVSGNFSTGWAQIALVYYKDFPALAIKNNIPVRGCILKLDSGRSYWHCKERVYLLRPVSPAASLKQKRQRLKLNAAEFNFNHTGTRIVSVHFLGSPPALSYPGYVPVTGIFITHSLKVKQYKFKNLSTGHISSIRATRDHPFYTENSRSFVPVSRVSSADHLLNDQQETVHLLCPANRTAHCGITVSQSLPMQVYNLETDRKHTFFAGDEKIFVHNCNPPLPPYFDFSSMLPLNDFQTYEDEGKTFFRARLFGKSASALLEHTWGAKNINPEKVAYYVFCDDGKGASSGVLFFKKYNASNLTAQSPENIVAAMRLAPEFDTAETVLIINSAPATKAEIISRDFEGYFREVATISGKNIIYNTKSPLLLTTLVESDNNSSRVGICVAGLYPQNDMQGTSFFRFNWFDNNDFRLVSPHE